MDHLQNLVETLQSGDSFEYRNKFGKVYASLSYIYNLRLLHVIWSGFVTPEDIKTAANDFIRVTDYFQVFCIVNDNKAVEGPWYDAIDWIVNDWHPRAVNAGIKRMAQILSTDTYAALSGVEMLDSISKLGCDLEVKSFNNHHEAKDWFLEYVERQI